LYVVLCYQTIGFFPLLYFLSLPIDSCQSDDDGNDEEKKDQKWKLEEKRDFEGLKRE
jgi:hypothetical protein